MAGARHRRPLARAVVLAALAAGVGLSAAACAGEWSGRVGAELRLFTQSPADPRQEGPSNLSLVAEPEYYTAWNGKRDGFTFVPFLRLDQHDGGRTHADIRELTWLHAADDWELRAGIRKVFWGVTEAEHLVDIVFLCVFVFVLVGVVLFGLLLFFFVLFCVWGLLVLFVLLGFCVC